MDITKQEKEIKELQEQLEAEEKKINTHYEKSDAVEDVVDDIKKDNKPEDPAEEAESTEESAQEEAAQEQSADDDDEESPRFTTKKQKQAFAESRKALRQEKERAEKAEKERNELLERIARLEGAEQARSQQRPDTQSRTTEPAQEPDRSLDPDAWYQWKLEDQDRKYNQLKQQLVARDIENLWLNHERAYAEKYPYYNDAKTHLIEGRMAEYKQAYPYATPEQIRAQVDAEERQLINTAITTGEDPADKIMFYATKYGYQPKAKQQERKAQPEPEAEDDYSEKDFNKIQRNMRKTQPLPPGASRGPSSQELTEEMFLAMGLDQIAKLPQSKIKALDERSTQRYIEDLQNRLG